MHDHAKAMNDLFVSQFEERQGLLVYQPISFVLPWMGGNQTYIVSAAERDRFIADFQRECPVIMRRMVIDIFIAFFSFAASSQILHGIFGDYATTLELALLLAHLGTIIVVENRRLKEIWDAPLRAIGNRAPAPFAPKRKYGLIKPVARMDGGELALGGAMGLIGAGCLGLLLTAEPTSAFSPVKYYAGLVLFGLIVALGIRCAIEGAERLLGSKKAG